MSAEKNVQKNAAAWHQIKQQNPHKTFGGILSLKEENEENEKKIYSI